MAKALLTLVALQQPTIAMDMYLSIHELVFSRIYRYQESDLFNQIYIKVFSCGAEG